MVNGIGDGGMFLFAVPLVAAIRGWYGGGGKLGLQVETQKELLMFGCGLSAIVMGVEGCSGHKQWWLKSFFFVQTLYVHVNPKIAPVAVSGLSSPCAVASICVLQQQVPAPRFLFGCMR